MKVLKAIWLTVCYPLLYLGAQVVAGSVYVFTTAFAAAMANVLANESTATSDSFAYAKDSMMGSYLQIILVISCAITLLVIYLIKRRDWKRTGFLRLTRDAARYIPLGVAAGVGCAAALSILIDISGLTDFFPEYLRVAESMRGGSAVLRVIGIGLIGPICEEVIFRGLVFGHLSTKMKLPLAIALQAAIFGFIHLNVLQGAYAAALGVVLGLVYVWFGSVWAPITVHIAFNMVSVTFSLLNETASAFAAQLLYALVALLAVVFVMAALHKKRAAIERSVSGHKPNAGLFVSESKECNS